MKSIALTSAILMAGLSFSAFSAEPPAAPARYDSSHISPKASTDLSDAERAAHALYEAVLMTAEAKIHADGCGPSAGSYKVSIHTNGLVASDTSESNTATISTPDESLTFDADLQDKEDYHGQTIDIFQVGPSSLGGKGVSTFNGVATYNAANNILFQQSSVKVMGINGRFDQYKSNVIKNFYLGEGSAVNTIFGWGLQPLHKLGYPVNKYMQRSKSLRSNGGAGRTVFVNDRLVGSDSCRITVDTMGHNKADVFSQSGNLVISTVNPGEPVSEFN